MHLKPEWRLIIKKDNYLYFGSFCRQLKCLLGVIQLHSPLLILALLCSSCYWVPSCVTCSLIKVSSLSLLRASKSPRNWEVHKSPLPSSLQHYNIICWTKIDMCLWKEVNKYMFWRNSYCSISLFTSLVEFCIRNNFYF